MSEIASAPRSQPKVHSFPDLPEVLHQRALLCASERKVPLEIPVLVSLVAIATSIGKGLVGQSGRQRETRGNLFILLGTSSGIGKSEVFRDMMGPVLNFERELHEWWETEPATKARAGEELLKAQVSGLRAIIRKYPQGNFGIFERLQVSERKRIICSRYIDAPCLVADDATSEALGVLMAGSGETIATVSADARYQLKRLSVTDSKEESFFLKGYSGDLALSSRITRKAARLRSPCLTTLYLTQRDSYRAFIKKVALTRSGLLPRFLHGDFAIMEGEVPGIDLRRAPTIRSSYQQRIQELIETFRFESESTFVKPSEEAFQFLESIEKESRESAARDESIHGEILRRRAEQSWRVALCLHAAEHGAQSSLHPLSLVHAQCAARIVKRFTALKT